MSLPFRRTTARPCRPNPRLTAGGGPKYPPPVLSCAAWSSEHIIQIKDAIYRGREDFVYRLRIGPPRPDFELRIVPSTINVRGSATVPVTVYALRKDGFSDEITLEWKGAPEGFALVSARVPADQDQARLTLA